MTEIAERWPNLLEVAAAHVRYAGDPSLAEKLSRLASLLEQITPETVQKLRAEARYQLSADEGADTDVGELLRGVADLLSALAAPPTEEP